MTVWLTIAALAVGTIAVKAAGPVAFGRRRRTRQVDAVVGLVPSALLAALVVYETLDGGRHRIGVDARVPALAAAALALRLRLPLIAVIGVAAAVAAIARAL